MSCKIIYVFLSLEALASAAIIPRVSPQLQAIPATAKPDNTFNVGTFYLTRERDISTEIPPAIYGSRPIDLPFGRLYHGNMNILAEGNRTPRTVLQTSIQQE